MKSRWLEAGSSWIRARMPCRGGELRQAIDLGAVTADHIHAEIGEVLNGTRTGRTDQAMITTYKSLGHVAQDIAVAELAQRRLLQSSSVVHVPW